MNTTSPDDALEVAWAARLWLDAAAVEYAAGRPWLAGTLSRIGDGYATLALAEAQLARLDGRENSRLEALHQAAGDVPRPPTESIDPDTRIDRPQ